MTGVRGFVVLALALLAGLVATIMAARWLGDRAGAAVVPVVVASRDIEPGQVLDVSALQTVAWPSASLPKGVFNEPARLEGRVIKSSLARGEPVLDSRLAPQGTRGGLSAVIGEGRRAITVKVNEVIGVAGFALPGNYVDVLVSTQDETDRAQMVSRIVLERILVLAVAQEASRDETRPKVVSAVTLEVSPHQAARLDLARSVGQLSLVLRNQVDRTTGLTPLVTKAELLRHEAMSGAPAPARAVAANVQRPAPAQTPRRVSADTSGPPVEIIRGIQRSRSGTEEKDLRHAN
jgi:pilus assembly protein CpaB